MGSEIVEEQMQDDVIPNLHLAFYIHYMSHGRFEENREISRKKVMKFVEQQSMTCMYQKLCSKFGWPIDSELLATMISNNQKELQRIDKAIKSAEKNLGEVEIKICYFKKAQFYTKIGDEQSALNTFRIAIGKALPFSLRFTAGFHLTRMAICHRDYVAMESYINQLKRLMAYQHDWGRMNRLKIYEGVYCICKRDFQTACNLFVDNISSFTTYEVMCYGLFVRNTIYLATMCLSRNSLKEKIIDNQRIGIVLDNDPELKSYLYSFYNCQYSEFFIRLGNVERYLKEDFLFRPHHLYYIREMKVVAYKQILESYSSLTLTFLAEQFGVTVDYIEEYVHVIIHQSTHLRDISLQIRTGRLYCRINRETDRVENEKPNYREHQYQMIITQGDTLLNKVQKLFYDVLKT